MSRLVPKIATLELPTGGKAFALPTHTKDTISIVGSLIGGPAAFEQGLKVPAGLAASMLDAGAGKYDRDAFRDALASRGAEISIGAAGTRVSFSARCFPEDLDFVLARLADALFDPHLPAKELAAERTRAHAAVKEESGDTYEVAERALLRALYPASHPNRPPTFAEEMRAVDAAGLADIRKVVRSYGTQHFILAATGDVDAARLTAAARRSFGRSSGGRPRPGAGKPSNGKPVRDSLELADKANVDVLMGARLNFTKADPRYLPTALVVRMLGGSFTSHLMQTLRERDGLTYDVRAGLPGFGDGLDGFLLISASFAPTMLETSVAKLEEEVRNFFATGITPEAVERVKDEIAGSFAVSLSTTAGLAARLAGFAEDDRPLSWMDEYPNLIRAITMEEVEDAARNLASLPLSLVTAGSATFAPVN